MPGTAAAQQGVWGGGWLSKKPFQKELAMHRLTFDPGQCRALLLVVNIMINIMASYYAMPKIDHKCIVPLEARVFIDACHLCKPLRQSSRVLHYKSFCSCNSTIGDYTDCFGQSLKHQRKNKGFALQFLAFITNCIPLQTRVFINVCHLVKPLRQSSRGLYYKTFCGSNSTIEDYIDCHGQSLELKGFELQFFSIHN